MPKSQDHKETTTRRDKMPGVVVRIPRVETMENYQVFVVQCQRGAKSWTIKPRYSAFDDLRKATLRDAGAVEQPFPAKQLLGGRLTGAQTEKRREQLEGWFQGLCSLSLAGPAKTTLSNFLKEPLGSSGPSMKAAPQAAAKTAAAAPQEEDTETVVPVVDDGVWDESFMSNDPLAMLAPEPEEKRPTKPKKKENNTPTKKEEVEPPPKKQEEEEVVEAAPSFLVKPSSSFFKPKEYEQSGEGLRNAVKDGDFAAVTQLLEVDPGLATYTDRQMSMLHLACIFDNSDIALALVEAGADPNVQDQASETPLDLAPPSLKVKIQNKVKAMANK